MCDHSLCTCFPIYDNYVIRNVFFIEAINGQIKLRITLTGFAQKIDDRPSDTCLVFYSIINSAFISCKYFLVI